MYQYSLIIASTYGSSSYGTNQYQSGASTGSTVTSGGTGTTGSSANGGTTTAGGHGVLTDTGFDILAAGALACLIIFAALVIRFWKRPRTGDAA